MTLQEHSKSVDDLPLLQKLERLQLAIEGTSDGIWVWDVDSPEIELTARFAELLGFTQNELGNSVMILRSLVHPDDIHLAVQAREHHVHNAQPYDVQMRLRTKAGKYRWFRVRGVSIRDQYGKSITMAGSILDIHELVSARTDLEKERNELEKQIELRSESLRNTVEQLEQKIREHEHVEKELINERERFKDLYDNAPDMYASVCSRTRKIIHCNNTVEKVLGFSKEEFQGKDLFEIYDQSSHALVKSKFKEFQEHGEVAVNELRLLRKDGGFVEVSLNVSATRDSDGNILTSRSIWRDLSDQKRIERELRLRDEQLSHISGMIAIGEIAAELGHELNQPLGAITNYLAAASESLKSNEVNVALIQELIQKVDSQARRCSQVISSLRKIVKKQPMRTEKIRVGETVSSAIDLVQPALKAENVKLLFDNQSAESMTLADDARLQQVFINIIQNAIQALRANGSTQKQIFVRLSESDGDVELQFADNGPGICDSQLEQIFEPFRTSREDGTGLGLSISRSIVHAFNGEIEAKPNDPAGTIISIRLPRVQSVEECNDH